MNGRRAFDPASDVALLAERFHECGEVALLIVDPIVSAVAADSHKNGEVRRSLQPLVDLAAAHGCALIGITHYSKGTAGRDPLERVTGSLASYVTYCARRGRYAAMNGAARLLTQVGTAAQWNDKSRGNVLCAAA